MLRPREFSHHVPTPKRIDHRRCLVSLPTARARAVEHARGKHARRQRSYLLVAAGSREKAALRLCDVDHRRHAEFSQHGQRGWCCPGRGRADASIRVADCCVGAATWRSSCSTGGGCTSPRTPSIRLASFAFHGMGAAAERARGCTRVLRSERHLRLECTISQRSHHCRGELACGTR